MASNIVKHDIQGLIDGWIEAEQNGERFPVPFDLAWTIAGYSRKDNAKRKLTNKNSTLTEGEDFAFLNRAEWTQDGRSSDSIGMSCDGFKQFCLMAGTDEGRNIRLYFIEAEKKWKLVQKHAPEVAKGIELIQYQIELAKIEAQKEQAIAQAKQADLQLVHFRHLVTSTMPEPMQQKILGYERVKEIEYRDRIIHDDDIVRDGSTVNKTLICKRLGILTRSGKPDYKRLNAFIEKLRLPDDAFEMAAVIQENKELKAEYLDLIEDAWINGSDRNFYLGE